MRVCVADLEGNGLLDDITKIHCVVFQEVVWVGGMWCPDGEPKCFYPGSSDGWLDEMFAYMDTVDKLCMHNGVGYDWPVFEKLFGYVYRGEKVDTLLISRLHNPKRKLPPHCPTHVIGKDGKKKRVGPHSVQAWGFRVGRGKVEHEDWEEFSPEMLHRCKEDVAIQLLIWNELINEADGDDWENAYRLTFKLFEILGKQERYGWLVDQPHLKRCICLLSRQMELIDERVIPLLPLKLEIEEGGRKDSPNWVKKPFKKNGDYSMAVYKWLHSIDRTPEEVNIVGPFTRINFRKLNTGSGAEIKTFLLSEGWEPKDWNVSKLTGERTSPKMGKDETFEGVTGPVGRLIARRIICRHRRSQLEGWLDGIRPDGRLSSRVTNLAETARATHAVIVNVPGPGVFFGRQMRKVFICKEGYKIVGTDSAGCQNRMLAARVGDEFFTKTLIEGDKAKKTDIHNVNTRAINAALDEHAPNFPNRTNRKLSKGLNYGTLFGASDPKIGKMMGGPPEIGKIVKDAIFGVAPGFQKLVDGLTEEWEATAKQRPSKKFRGMEKFGGKVKGLDGRPIVINSPHAILVYMLQSDEAIMMSAAYCFLYKWCEDRGWKWGEDYAFMCWMHDEFQCEVKDEIVEEFALLAEKAIVTAGEYYKIHCPHKGESDIGVNWCQTH